MEEKGVQHAKKHEIVMTTVVSKVNKLMLVVFFLPIMSFMV